MLELQCAALRHFMVRVKLHILSERRERDLQDKSLSRSFDLFL